MSLIEDFHKEIGFYIKYEDTQTILNAEQGNIFSEIVGLLSNGCSSEYIYGFLKGYMLCKASTPKKKRIAYSALYFLSENTGESVV